MKTSLIISTYRAPHFLDLVLESVARQSAELAEIVITEDGRYDENKILVDMWSRRLKTKLIHLHQKDQGNRKPLALNRAIAASHGDYLIFVDEDCVLRSDFVAAHLEFIDEKHFLTGRRVELSPMATEAVTSQRIRSGALDGFPWFLAADAIFGKTHNLGRMLRTPRWLRGAFGREKIDDIRGCNFSVHRRHLVSINGFSNEFSGAYGEDSDVEYRLKFLGLKMKSLKGAAIQYHLWHPSQNKDAENQARLKKVLAEGQPRTPNGLGEIANFS